MQDSTQLQDTGAQVGSEPAQKSPLAAAVEEYAAACKESAAAIAAHTEAQADQAAKTTVAKVAEERRVEADFAYSYMMMVQRELDSIRGESQAASIPAQAAYEAIYAAAEAGDTAAVEAAAREFQKTEEACRAINNRALARQLEALISIGCAQADTRVISPTTVRHLYSLGQTRDAAVHTALEARDAEEKARKASSDAWYTKHRAETKLTAARVRMRMLLREQFGQPHG